MRRRAINLLDHQARVERAVGSGDLWQSDQRLAVTTAGIRFAFEVERQLEVLFAEYVLGKRRGRGIEPRMLYRSPVVLAEHVLHGRRYVGWLPYEETEKRAQIFLRGGRPFSEMSGQGRKAFKEISVIRNLLAHESAHSKVQFEKAILASRSVPSYERSVERYLTGTHSTGVSRLESHMVACVQAFEELV